MKKLYTILTAVILTATVWAQSPQKLSYQAVIRDAGNDLVTETEVGIQISILQGAPDGTAVYVEKHAPVTNENGLTSIEIGDGDVESGVFADIDWSAGPYYVKTEIDPDGGSTYTIEGTSQLLSVPYALYADYAENASDKVAFHVYNSSTDALSTTGWHIVELDNEIFDDGNNFNNTDDQFVAPYDGVYSFSGTVSVDDLVDMSLVIIGVFVNGSHCAYYLREYINEHTQSYSANGSLTVKLNAGDIVDLRVYIGGDTDYTISSGDYYTYFSGHLVYR
ncbi:MAG: hypothetical protein JW894_12620 [Bacteroidales bacterium]|nr:hypothetical protein [Bacteroidales bacterium]